MTRQEQQQADIDALLGSKYQILAHVGGGGMAQVLLARHRLHGGLFAIKILADHLAQDPSIVARFKQEATTAASLSGHPNIVPIFDIGEGRGLHYLVMQFVTGEDLSSYLRREGKLSVAAAAGVIAQAAEALCWAESKHVVHRDLKPANMHLDTTGRIKILDFGISKITDVAEADGLTRPGEALGTPFYMSPEQIRGEACDSRSDLYSLGVVFFELLTGHRPFENQSATAIQIAHLSTPPPSVLQYDATIPPMCDEIIQRLLRKDRSERYSSVDELLKQLHNNGASSGPSALRPVMDASLSKAISEAPTLGAAAPTLPPEPVPEAVAAPKAAPATVPPPAAQHTESGKKSPTLAIGIAAAAVLALAAGGTAYFLHERSHTEPTAVSSTAGTPAASTPSTVVPTPATPTASAVPAEAAKLMVRTKIPGVQVYVNGVPKGLTAANGQLLVDTIAGPQEVRVDKAGFKTPPSHSVTASGKRTETIAFNMVPGEASPPPTPAPVVASAPVATAAAAPAPGAAAAVLLPKVKLQLSSQNITVGQPVTLTWHSENVNNLSIDGVGAVEPNGSRALMPTASTSYTALARGPGGSAADSVHVEVAPLPKVAAPAPTPAATVATSTADSGLSGVKQALQRYKEAYESESLDDLKQVWPGMSKDQQKGLKEAFKFNAIRLNLDFNDSEVHVSGDDATVNCRQAFMYTVNGKKQAGPNTSTRITLHKQGHTWQIASVADH